MRNKYVYSSLHNTTNKNNNSYVSNLISNFYFTKEELIIISNLVYNISNTLSLNKYTEFNDISNLMILIKNIANCKNYDFNKFCDSLGINFNKFNEIYNELCFNDNNKNKNREKIINYITTILLNFNTIDVIATRIDNNYHHFLKLLNIKDDDIHNKLFFGTLFSINRDSQFNDILNLFNICNNKSLDLHKYHVYIDSMANPMIVNHPILSTTLDEMSYSIYAPTNNMNISSILFTQEYDTYEKFTKAILGKPLPYKNNNLVISIDFKRFQNDADIITKIINSREEGTNILVHGSPGTGKSEFVKLLCKKNKYDVYNIDPNIDDDFSRSRTLHLKQQLLENNNNSVIIFDEAQDYFGNNIFKPNIQNDDILSKASTVNFMEHNKVPIIWITNSILFMDEAYIRRNQYMIQMDSNTNEERKRCINLILKNKKYNVSNINDMINVVNKYRLKYAIISNYVNNMIKIKGDSKDFIDMIEKYADIMELKSYESDVINNYDLSLINTDTNLNEFIEQIKETEIKDFSLLLHGVPGTGKSEFAKYLAQQLNIPYIKKKASDLLGMYVGENEKNIAEAFKEAKNDSAVLIIDEVDSFLQSRKNAQHSWEVSTVNELLTQLESFDWPFIATTNFIVNLDDASFRRFDYKIKYDYMLINQVIKAFKIFFNIKVNNKEVSNLTKLTPGDFKCVQDKIRLIKNKSKNNIIELLIKEQDYKQERSAIGF